MDTRKIDQAARRASDRPKAPDQDGQSIPPSGGSDVKAKDADTPASKPQGTLCDQVKTMESEGQAQPQAGDVPPEETEEHGTAPLPEREGVGQPRRASAGRSDKGLRRDQE